MNDIKENHDELDMIRHSASHLMAQAIIRVFPGTKLGIGPSIKDGFYYDVLPPKPITPEDLPAIKKEMKHIVSQKIPVEHIYLPRNEAIALFKERGEDFKIELIEKLPDENISLYRQSEFIDLCLGSHVANTAELKHTELLSVAGAYWHGDENNVMLTRIYGTAFADKEALEAHLKRLEEAKLRDHRKLGKELDLFSLHQEGPGFPCFHPKGMAVINKLLEFWKLEHSRRGYTEIRTPLILDRSLWLRSGHWDHYRDNMYFTEIDERPFAIKPMNCPGSIMVYKNSLKSYRDLPMRMAELGIVHRHERSGVLHGLMRVRCFTQDDAHIYCTPSDVGAEIARVIDLMHYIFSEVFGFTYNVELSTRPKDFMGEISQWDEAERELKEALEATATAYKLNPGDGAFYGPKIDFHLEDSIGRTWQCGTIQLDFQMPEKFDVTYIGSDGAEHRPVMIHRTVLGSVERFFGILIEHYAGAFPYWIAPVQVRLIPVSSEQLPYALELEKELKAQGVRVEVDTKDEKLGKKIRDAQLQKIPYMCVIGKKEVEEHTISVRERAKGDLGAFNMDDFLQILKEEFSPC